MNTDTYKQIKQHLDWTTSGGRHGKRMVISNQNMRCCDLSGMDLSSITFDHCDLSTSNMNHACFRGAIFKDCNLHHSQLSNCSFQEAIFSHCDFTVAHLNNSIFTYAEISDCNFNEAYLYETDLSGAVINNSSFNQCVLVGCIGDGQYICNKELIVDYFGLLNVPVIVTEDQIVINKMHFQRNEMNAEIFKGVSMSKRERFDIALEEQFIRFEPRRKNESK